MSVNITAPRPRAHLATDRCSVAATIGAHGRGAGPEVDAEELRRSTSSGAREVLRPEVLGLAREHDQSDVGDQRSQRPAHGRRHGTARRRRWSASVGIGQRVRLGADVGFGRRASTAARAKRARWTRGRGEAGLLGDPGLRIGEVAQRGEHRCGSDGANRSIERNDPHGARRPASARGRRSRRGSAATVRLLGGVADGDRSAEAESPAS